MAETLIPVTERAAAITLDSDRELDLLRELAACRLRIRQITAILRGVTAGYDKRPEWGPCTRCRYIWKGNRVGLPPRACARCGSTGWRIPPISANSRKPSDPPLPAWGKNRITKQPRNPDDKVGKRDYAKERSASGGGRIAGAGRVQSFAGVEEMRLTPPPKPPHMDTPPAKPSLVPSQSVRFADALLEPPQPERSVSRMPEDERVELVAGDGVIQEDNDGTES